MVMRGDKIHTGGIFAIHVYLNMGTVAGKGRSKETIGYGGEAD
jgi:hypothetical protein